jgi:hypothetical protein
MTKLETSRAPDLAPTTKPLMIKHKASTAAAMLENAISHQKD